MLSSNNRREPFRVEARICLLLCSARKSILSGFRDRARVNAPGAIFSTNFFPEPSNQPSTPSNLDPNKPPIENEQTSEDKDDSKIKDEPVDQ